MRPIRYAPAAVLTSAVLMATAAHGQTAKRTLNADGTTSMTYSGEVSDVGTQVGLALSTDKTTVAPVAQPGSETVSGTAFAKVTLAALPDWLLWQKGAVNVAVSPTEEESKLGTTLSRSWTINDGLRADLVDTYQLDRSGADNGWEMNKSLSMTSLATDTTLSVGASLSDEASRLLPSISARQKVLGGINVTTTVADTGSDISKSISAGFSRRW